MANSWDDVSYRELLGEFARGKPTPGGGAAGALAGALGSALVCMVCSLTIGRKGYLDAEARMERVLERAGELKAEFLGLAHRDAEAFDRVMAAYRLPKRTAEEKERRGREVEVSLKGAAEVPLEVMRCAVELVRLGKEVLEFGNKNAASDAAASARLGAAAVAIGKYNVDINLAGLGDGTYAEKTRREAEEIGSQSENLVEEVERIFTHHAS